jgi:hypothetical protein
MVKHKLSQLRQQLQAIRTQMDSIWPTFMSGAPLLKAYLSFTPRTCGNPGCQCHRQGKLHAAWVVRIPQGRRVQTRCVSREVFEGLKPQASAYRSFRQAYAQWRELVRKADRVIKEIEALRRVEPRKELERA